MKLPGIHIFVRVLYASEGIFPILDVFYVFSDGGHARGVNFLQKVHFGGQNAGKPLKMAIFSCF